MTDVLECRFTGPTTAIVPEFDGGQHTFDVLPTPGTPAPADGDRGWLLETAGGEYVVIAWVAA